MSRKSQVQEVDIRAMSAGACEWRRHCSITIRASFRLQKFFAVEQFVTKFAVATFAVDVRDEKRFDPI